MDKKLIMDALKKAREDSPKRNFKQSFDFIVNMKGLDLKKNEQQVEFFMQLVNPRGKKPKVCALVGAELVDEAKGICDFTIVTDDFPKYAESKKLTKKLAEDYDYFIAQANIMAKIASTFGRTLGPRGKMPNPKAGCVVPPKFNLKPLYEKLQKTVKISAKILPMVQTAVGTEEMKDEEIAENAWNIYDQLIHHLPNDKNNVSSVFVKLTMGKPVRIGEKAGEEQKTEKKRLLPKKSASSEAVKTEAVA